MFRGIVNSLIISGSCAVLCTYFSSLTAYGLYAYDFKLKKAAFTFIMRYWLCRHRLLRWLPAFNNKYGNV